jgi:hypothetical protein
LILMQLGEFDVLNRRKRRKIWENLLQYHRTQHKYHMKWPGFKTWVMICGRLLASRSSESLIVYICFLQACSQTIFYRVQMRHFSDLHHSRYSNEEQKQILQILNESSAEEMCR